VFDRKYWNRIGGQKHRLKRRRFLWAYKSKKGCYVCGEKDPIVLDLHHRDPNTKHEKCKGIYGRSGGGYNRLNDIELLAEMEKCDVVCSNCHRRIEWHSKNGA